MKKVFRNIGVFVTVIIIFILIILAIVCRFSFTQYDDLGKFKVSLYSEEISDVMIPNLKSSLLKSKNIFKVRCTSGAKMGEKVIMQSAEVLKVFEGKDALAGQNILISPYSSWIYSDDMSVNMGYVNVMKENDEYLVFLGEPIDVVDRDLTVFLTVEGMITTAFSYEERENALPKVIDSELLLVDYNLVKDNEFFMETQAMLDEMNETKKELLEKYP